MLFYDTVIQYLEKENLALQTWRTYFWNHKKSNILLQISIAQLLMKI